jgi:hypothetical protein
MDELSLFLDGQRGCCAVAASAALIAAQVL